MFCRAATLGAQAARPRDHRNSILATHPITWRTRQRPGLRQPSAAFPAALRWWNVSRCDTFCLPCRHFVAWPGQEVLEITGGKLPAYVRHRRIFQTFLNNFCASKQVTGRLLAMVLPVQTLHSFDLSRGHVTSKKPSRLFPQMAITPSEKQNKYEN